MADYGAHLDRYWQAGEITFVTHLAIEKAASVRSDDRFGTDLEECDFTTTVLKRVRR